jgi:hypothetical protein
MIRRVDDADRHRSAVDRLGSVGSGSRLGRAYLLRSRIGLSWQTCACERSAVRRACAKASQHMHVHECMYVGIYITSY